MMIFILTMVFGLYCVTLLFAIIKWNKIQKVSLKGEEDSGDFYSVLIPVRNEEENILNLLQDLSHQNFPRQKFEVIIIDDSSEDNTVKIVKEYALHSDLDLKILFSADFDSKSAPKKKSIEYGITQSKGTVIMTIDGDCRCGKNWIKSTDNIFNSSDSVMVCGPVGFWDRGKLFEKMQQIEFSAVIGTSGVTLSSGFPTMANGANLSYRKSVFYEVKGFSGFETVASGDDEFMLHKVHANYPGKVTFNNSKEAVVTTFPKATMHEFLAQRRRWAGKWKLHKNKSNQYLALFVFIVNLLFIVSAVGSAFVPGIFQVFLGFATLKFITEFIFLKKVSDFLGHNFTIYHFIITWVLYPFYVIIIGFLSNSGSFAWKGRTIKS